MEWSGILLMAFIVFIPRFLQIGYNWPQIIHSLYYAFSKPIFLSGLLLVVTPTLLGYRKSFFNTILTAKLFHFISRISFCTYLVHLLVITQFIYTIVIDTYYNTLDVFVTYLGLLALSLFFGLLTTLIIELPFSVLQKNLIDFLKKQKNRKNLKIESLLS
jgi:peptidoglycan/LPS O-acetylase OafA/YrhL